MGRSSRSGRSKRSKTKSVKRGRRKHLSSRRSPKTRGKQSKTRKRLPLSRTLIPHHRIVEMPYTQMLDYAASGTDVRHAQAFRLNSIFDPYAPIALTHQPRMHDQAKLQYEQYTVIGCSIRWTIIGQLATGPFLFYSHMPQEGESSVLPGVKSVFERRTDVLRRIVTSTSSFKRNPTTGTLKYNANKYFKSNFSSQVLQATPFGQNPADEVLGNFILQNIGAGDTTIKVKFDIVYKVLLDERKPIFIS